LGKGQNNRTISGEPTPLDSRILVDWLDYTVTKETASKVRNLGVLQADIVESNEISIVSTGVPHKNPLKPKPIRHRVR